MNRMILIVGIIVVLAVLAIVIGVTRTENQSESPMIEGLVLPKGVQTYQVSSNDPGPKIREVIVSELEPSRDEDQRMRVRVDYSEDVAKLTVSINRDGLAESHALTLVEGTEKDGWWEGSWKIGGTSNANYTARIIAESDAASSTVTLTFR